MSNYFVILFVFILCIYVSSIFIDGRDLTYRHLPTVKQRNRNVKMYDTIIVSYILSNINKKNIFLFMFLFVDKSNENKNWGQIKFFVENQKK